jgi:hypothetical protein
MVRHVSDSALKRRPIAEKYAAEIDALYTTKEEQ